MSSLPVEELPSKSGVRFRIKYNRTSFVLNILLTSVLLDSFALLRSGCVFGTTCIRPGLKVYRL